MKILKSVLGCLGILLGLFSLMIFWGWMLGRAEELGNEAHEKTLMPYFTAIFDGKTREAYDKYTSEGFKKRHSYADFEAAHAKHPKPDLRQFTKAGGGTGSEPIANGARLVYIWHYWGGGEKDYDVLYYDVVKTPEGPKIEETWGTYTVEYTSKAGDRSGERKLRQEIW